MKKVIEEAQKEEDAWRIVAITKLKVFRDVGEHFNYCGVDLLVESLWEIRALPGIVGPRIPRIRAAYKNTNGELKTRNFYEEDLPAMYAENKLSETTLYKEFYKKGTKKKEKNDGCN